MKLNSYGPGDGAIDLVWVQDDNQASGKEVTREDVLKHIAKKENRHLFDKGYRPLVVEGRYRLVKMYERLDADKLSPLMDKDENDVPKEQRVYSYKIKPEYGMPARISGLEVTFTMNIDEKGPLTLEVKSWNVLGSMAFFLNYEEVITRSLAEMKALTLPPLFDASRARRAERAVKGYAGEDHDLKANVTDVLTDLRHLCEKNGIDFDKALRSSADHFSAER